MLIDGGLVETSSEKLHPAADENESRESKPDIK